MTDISSVYIFYYDPVFLDTSISHHTILETTGISKLNQLGFSYFVDLHTISDTRNKIDRPIDWVGTTLTSILTDTHYYQQFVDLLNNSSKSVQNSVFNMLDILFFNKMSDQDADAYFKSTDGIKDIYVAGSVTSSSDKISDDYYIDNQKVNYTTNALKTFTINLTKDGKTYSFYVNAICEGAYWNNKYPNSWIQKVSPPVDYEKLLYMDFVRENSNTLSLASNTAGFIGSNILPGYAPTDIPSGYLNYSVVVRDKARNQTLATFTIIYKGSKPSPRKIRDAIRDDIKNSGVGTEDEWKDRIPEIYITLTMFLVPQWDNVYPKSDKTMYPGSMNVNKLLEVSQKVLPFIDSYVVHNKLDVVISSYNKMFLAAIPEDYINKTATDILTFSKIRPDYQAFSTTEPNFSYMSQGSQQFGICLTDTLTLLNTNRSDPIYPINVEGDLEYMAFTIEEVEYCVVTPDSYNLLLLE